MARLKRRKSEDATMAILDAWPFESASVDASQCFGEAAVALTLSELHRAYALGYEDGHDSALGHEIDRAATVDVFALKGGKR